MLDMLPLRKKGHCFYHSDSHINDRYHTEMNEQHYHIPVSLAAAELATARAEFHRASIPQELRPLPLLGLEFSYLHIEEKQAPEVCLQGERHMA